MRWGFCLLQQLLTKLLFLRRLPEFLPGCRGGGFSSFRLLRRRLLSCVPLRIVIWQMPAQRGFQLTGSLASPITPHSSSAPSCFMRRGIARRRTSLIIARCKPFLSSSGMNAKMMPIISMPAETNVTLLNTIRLAISAQRKPENLFNFPMSCVRSLCPGSNGITLNSSNACG